MVTRRLLPAMMIALLLSALFTAWLSRRFSRPTVQAAVATKRLVTVSKNVAAGEALQADSLKVVERPALESERGAFAKVDEVNGRVLLIPMNAGDAVLDRYLAATGVNAGLTTKIPEGMRAISLRTDEVVGVAGFLLPGSLVDVLVTYSASSSAPLVTATVLQNARVLAEGQKMEPETDGKAITADVVTLLVSPQDAQKLTLATSLGKIHFILRNGADRKETAGLAPQMSLPGEVAPRSVAPEPSHEAHRVVAVKAAAPARVYTVDTVTGGKQTGTTFEERVR